MIERFCDVHTARCTLTIDIIFFYQKVISVDLDKIEQLKTKEIFSKTHLKH